jgi:hypothetical protein
LELRDVGGMSIAVGRDTRLYCNKNHAKTRGCPAEATTKVKRSACMNVEDENRPSNLGMQKNVFINVLSSYRRIVESPC